MRFELVPYGAAAPDGAASCDGLSKGARLDLTHWANNNTPAHLKADTSVEIALNFNARRADFDVELAVNNHFDTDGVLAVWCLLSPDLAAEQRAALIAASEVGDFDEWPSDDRGLMLDAAISNLTEGMEDPEAYQAALPKLDALIPNITAHEALYSGAFSSLRRAEEDLSRGRVVVQKLGRITVFHHGRSVPELLGPVLSRARVAGTDRVLLAFDKGDGTFEYRYELPRYAWADTVVRPPLVAPKRGDLYGALGSDWNIKGKKGMTGLIHTKNPCRVPPKEVAERLIAVDR